MVSDIYGNIREGINSMRRCIEKAPAWNKKYSIHFIVNFHGINHFLSVYNSDDNNVIVIHKNKSIENFVRGFLRYDKLIILPQFRVGRYIFEIPFSAFVVWYKCLFLKNISPSSTAYLYNMHDPSFCFVIKYLQKRNFNFFYTNPHKKSIVLEKIPSERTGFKYKVYRTMINSFTGLDLAWYKTNFVDVLGFKRTDIKAFNEKSIDVLSWTRIKKKINFSLNMNTDKSVLIIDVPIQVLKDVLLVESRERLVNFFTRILNSGKKIYLKPHYSRPDDNSFSGTDIEKSLFFLPADFPVELIIDEFAEIYFYTSAASIGEGRKKYSFFNLIEFCSNENKLKELEAYKYALKDELKNIEFI